MEEGHTLPCVGLPTFASPGGRLSARWIVPLSGSTAPTARRRENDKTIRTISSEIVQSLRALGQELPHGGHDKEVGGAQPKTLNGVRRWQGTGVCGYGSFDSRICCTFGTAEVSLGQLCDLASICEQTLTREKDRVMFSCQTPIPET